MKDQLDKLKSLERSLRNRRVIEHQLRKEIKQEHIRKPKSMRKKSLSPLILSPLVISSKKSAVPSFASAPLFYSKKSSPALLSVAPAIAAPAIAAPAIAAPAITLSIKEQSISPPSLTEQDIMNIVTDTPDDISSPPPYETEQTELPPAYAEQSPSNLEIEDVKDLSYRD